MEHKIQSKLEGNSMCFTYSSRGGGRVYSNVSDINKVSYETMLKMDTGEIFLEKDYFVEELLHGVEESIWGATCFYKKWEQKKEKSIEKGRLFYGIEHYQSR